jgi:hypothetical protein
MLTNTRGPVLHPQEQWLERMARTSVVLLILVGLLAAPSAAGSSSAMQSTDGTQDPETSDAEAAKPEFTPPGKRRAINGVASITGLTYLVFPSAPDQAYQLEFTYVFPDRVRWHMAPKVEGSDPEEKNNRPLRRTQNERLANRGSRRLMYRFGAGAWSIEPGQTSSAPYEGDQQRITLLQFELRRCALIWPAEFEWATDGQLRRTEIEGLGTLEVELDEESGLPLLMRSIDADGTVREEYKSIQWQERQPDADAKTPPAPKSWQLHVAGKHIWTEEFQNLRTGLRYNDAFFKPFDRRKKTRMVSSPQDGVEQIEIPRLSVWREDLSAEAKADWNLALEQARKAIAIWKPQLEGTDMLLDERPAFLLDDQGKPLRLELRMKGVADYPPARWFTQWGIPALRQARVGTDGLDENLIKRVSSKAPKSMAASTALLVVQLTASGAGVTQLMVPLISIR